MYLFVLLCFGLLSFVLFSFFVCWFVSAESLGLVPASQWPAGDLGCAVWLGETWCASAAQATDLPRRDPQELPMQDRRGW